MSWLLITCPFYTENGCTHTPIALAVFGTKLFRSLQSREAHIGVGGLWGGREVAFFGALAKGNVSSSIALAGRGFLPKSCFLIKYSPLCNWQRGEYRTYVCYRTYVLQKRMFWDFAKSQTYVSSLCTKSLCLTFLCGVWACLGKDTCFFRHWVELATPTRRMATFLGDQCDWAGLQLTVENQKYL